MDAGNRRERGRAPISQINVTPLVDVMLVLLIIFMVTAAVGQQGITVSLPRARAQALERTEGIVVVSVDRDLKAYVDSKEVALSDLGPALRALYSTRKDKTAFLKADRGVAYGDFIKVVSLIKDSGVDRLGMITEAPKR